MSISGGERLRSPMPRCGFSSEKPFFMPTRAFRTFCARRQVNQHAELSGQTDADDDMYAPDGFPRALWWDPSTSTLRLVDQTLLPRRYRIPACETGDEVAEAIRTLRVRGAPAIGVAAGYGLALEARRGLDAATAPQEAVERLRESAARLRATRPTAVNLAWALGRLMTAAERHLVESDEQVSLA